MPLDPNWSSVSTLLHGEGTNGSATYTDNAPTPKTYTQHGNVQVSTAQAKYGSASLLFDGSGDWLTAPDHADFAFGSGDFTLEYFIRMPAAGISAGAGIFTKNASGVVTPFQVYMDPSTGKVGFLVSFDASTYAVSLLSATAISADTWTHIACVRNGNVFTVYIDGVSRATTTQSGTIFTNATSFVIGANNTSGGFSLNGYLDEVRVTKGVARYTTGFTPPTAAFPDSDTGNIATGFTSTTFGTPLAKFNQSAAASGFNSTTFGTPNAAYTQFGAATGFVSTAFGTPYAVFSQFGAATGINSTTFGAPRLTTITNATGIAPTTTFGTPVAPTASTGWLATVFGTPWCVQHVPSGWLVTHFGTPTGHPFLRAQSWITSHFGTPTTPTNRAGVATGFAPVQFGPNAVALQYVIDTPAYTAVASEFLTGGFGTPTAHSARRGVATGWLSPLLGTPLAIHSQRYAAVTTLGLTTHFGTPAARRVGEATGFRTTTFGTPNGRRIQAATGWQAKVRFGTPTYTRGANTHFVYGFTCAGRFGQPRAFNQHRYAAQGFISTALSSPACTQRRRVTGLLNGVTFGTPQLDRGIKC